MLASYHIFCLVPVLHNGLFRNHLMALISSLKVEKQFEKILKEKKGFVIKKTVEDGACLFRAVGRFRNEI